MRNTFTAISLAAFLALGAVACSGGGSSNSYNGSLTVSPPDGPTTPATAARPSTTAAAGPAAGLVRFAFPPSLKVEFRSALPASGPQRAAMIGYENYVDSGWYAVYTHGASKTVSQYVFGNALTDFHALVTELNGYRLSGTIVYSDISVPQVFNKAGAVVQACVDASGLYVANAKTGHHLETVFRSDFEHYQEQASAGKSAGASSWIVTHTVQSPGVCS
jgi:hypothetical protein